MENNLKYFKPEISDIHVGYECEVAYLEKDNWTPMKVRHQEETEDFIKAVFNYNRRIRTPYLTKEQIVAEGWEAANTGGVEKGWIGTRFCCSKDNYLLGVEFKNEIPIVLLVFRDPSKEEWVGNSPEFFRVVLPCPSINEFRTIIKLLNIK